MMENMSDLSEQDPQIFLDSKFKSMSDLAADVNINMKEIKSLSPDT